jgi:hypothetical protein
VGQPARVEAKVLTYLHELLVTDEPQPEIDGVLAKLMREFVNDAGNDEYVR